MGTSDTKLLAKMQSGCATHSTLSTTIFSVQKNFSVNKPSHLVFSKLGTTMMSSPFKGSAHPAPISLALAYSLPGAPLQAMTSWRCGFSTSPWPVVMPGRFRTMCTAAGSASSTLSGTKSARKRGPFVVSSSSSSLPPKPAGKITSSSSSESSIPEAFRTAARSARRTRNCGFRYHDIIGAVLKTRPPPMLISKGRRLAHSSFCTCSSFHGNCTSSAMRATSTGMVASTHILKGPSSPVAAEHTMKTGQSSSASSIAGGSSKVRSGMSSSKSEEAMTSKPGTRVCLKPASLACSLFRTTWTAKVDGISAISDITTVTLTF
mmetsp:Transcript_1339/g.2922  ORF Transcript_1339/g.2922 Transcript_1339/m.2922 type:complete len:320 (-) Transcript_1339:3855-4814(-)